jgi:hypothetical protein
MIIWRGWGISAILIAALFNVLMEQLTDNFLAIPDGFKHYRDAHSWVWLVGMWLSAAGCWFAGKALDAHELKNAKIVTDKETGQDIRIIGRNDMFWIPVKWWAVIWFGFGIWFSLSSK